MKSFCEQCCLRFSTQLSAMRAMRSTRAPVFFMAEARDSLHRHYSQSLFTYVDFLVINVFASGVVDANSGKYSRHVIINVLTLMICYHC